jgi:hypothetical protein
VTVHALIVTVPGPPAGTDTVTHSRLYYRDSALSAVILRSLAVWAACLCGGCYVTGAGANAVLISSYHPLATDRPGLDGLATYKVMTQGTPWSFPQP